VCHRLFRRQRQDPTLAKNGEVKLVKVGSGWLTVQEHRLLISYSGFAAMAVALASFFCRPLPLVPRCGFETAHSFFPSPTSFGSVQ
jgi:hypothetical protein